MGYIIIVLIVILILLISYLCFLKVTLKSITKQLQESNYERQVTIPLVDGDFIELAKAINCGIERGKTEVSAIKQKEEVLKNSILSVSHDLRTPLTAMIGYLQLLRVEKLEKEQMKLVDIVLLRGKELKRLITNFYELSILDLAGLEPIFETVDLLKVLPEYLLEFTDEFEMHEMIPQIITDYSSVKVHVDIFMMKRIVFNLISNAVKYGIGTLIISIVVEDSVTVVFENKINTNDSVTIEKVFDKFYVGNLSGYQGTGLGLYIAKEFMRKMNGNITAFKKGLVFGIQLEFPVNKTT